MSLCHFNIRFWYHKLTLTLSSCNMIDYATQNFTMSRKLTTLSNQTLSYICNYIWKAYFTLLKLTWNTQDSYEEFGLFPFHWQGNIVTKDNITFNQPWHLLRQYFPKLWLQMTGNTDFIIYVTKTLDTLCKIIWTQRAQYTISWNKIFTCAVNSIL